jgi:hypothetical protein
VDDRVGGSSADESSDSEGEGSHVDLLAVASVDDGW